MTDEETVDQVCDVLIKALHKARSNGVSEQLCDRAIVEAQQVMWEAGELDRAALH